MSSNLDFRRLVSHLTNTSPDNWEPFMGAKKGVGDEEWLTEIGDFGPEDEDVADMVRQGYISGTRWSLSAPETSSNDDGSVTTEIARLISEGFTSGVDPAWSVEINKISARDAYIQVFDDGEILVTITETARHTAIDHVTSLEELRNSPETSCLIADVNHTPSL